jgi:hypothetical protein
MPKKTKDPNEMTNRQRHARVEFLDKRMAADKVEKKFLTELIVADLHNPKS